MKLYLAFTALAVCTSLYSHSQNDSLQAICQDITLELDENSLAEIFPSDIYAGDFETSGIQTMVLDQTTFDLSHLGSNTVSLVVADEMGNTSTCTAEVTIVENSEFEYGVDIEINNPSSQFDEVEFALEFYPNPVQEELNIFIADLEAEFIEVELLAINGQVVFKGQLNSGMNQINVSKYDAGVYFLKVSSGADSKTEQITIR